MNGPRLGRYAGLAELLLLAETFDETTAARMAGTLGFARRKGTAAPASEPEQTFVINLATDGLQSEVTADEGEAPEEDEPQDVIDLAFWVVQKRMPLEVSANQTLSQPSDPAVDEAGEPTRVAVSGLPPFPARDQPLVAPPRLDSDLLLPLGGVAAGRILDIPAAVTRIARGELLHEVPRRREFCRPHELVVVIDGSAHLQPYKKAVWACAKALCAVLGASRSRIWWVEFNGEDRWCVWRGDKVRALPNRALHPDTTLLVLGDLGTLAPDSGAVARWCAVGREFAAMGVATAALLPHRPLRTRALTPWFCLVPTPEAGCEPWSPLGREQAEALRVLRDNALTRLVALASLTIQFNVALLWRLADLLPEETRGFGLPALVWHHEDVEDSGYAKRVKGSARDVYRHYWRAGRTAAAEEHFLRRAEALIQAAHQHLNWALRAEEATFFPFASGATGTLAPEFLEMLVRRMAVAGDQDTAYYVRRLVARLIDDVGVWTASEVWPRLVAHQRALMPAHRHEAIPPGCEAEVAAMEGGLSGPFKGYAVMYRAGRLWLEPESEDPTETAYQPRRPITRFETALAYTLHGPEPVGLKRTVLEENQRVALCDTGAGSCIVRTEREVITLAKIPLPEPAATMGEDRLGVYLDLKPEHGERRLRWLPPGAQTLPTGETWRVPEGAWVDARVYAALTQPDFPVPPWAHQVGRDVYGVFADFEIGAVTQRMRWILPGTFWMGESEETAEYDDEKPRHQVWITRPFWLAETACSQALWQAVMGDNPSSNQQPDHPVERVSHVDVGKFHARLSGLWSGADFGLPSEVQWEYACRAGTTTAFSFGNTASSEQANFNGNYPYGGTPKGVYRKQTVPVQGFDANDWGLFQMHGNVWEWCRDGQRTYHGHGVVDPLGPLREGVRRVVRGGSFDDNARSCRSAYRNALAPGLTWLLQGFRLAGSSWYLEEATERPQQASRSAGERISGTDIHPSARHHKESR